MPTEHLALPVPMKGGHPRPLSELVSDRARTPSLFSEFRRQRQPRLRSSSPLVYRSSPPCSRNHGGPLNSHPVADCLAPAVSPTGPYGGVYETTSQQREMFLETPVRFNANARPTPFGVESRVRPRPRIPDFTPPVPFCPDMPAGAPRFPVEADSRVAAPRLHMSLPRGNPLYCKVEEKEGGRPMFDYSERFQDWLAGARQDTFERQHENEKSRIDEACLAVGKITLADDEREVDREKHDGRSEPNGMQRGVKRYADAPSSTGPTSSKRGRIFSSIRSRLLPSSQQNLMKEAAQHPWDHDQAATATAAADVSRRSSNSRSLFSRMSMRAPSGVPSAMHPPPRRLKICMVGDTLCGKTTLIHRMFLGEYKPAAWSPSPDFKNFPVMTADGSYVAVEMWDVPGNEAVLSQNNPLQSNFFQAAIICYSIEKASNVHNVVYRWPPKLRESLLEGPIFVIGSKKDLRPDYPTLKLGFLQEEPRAERQTGLAAASSAKAVRFYECSAKTGEGVAEALIDIVSYVARHQGAGDRDKENRRWTLAPSRLDGAKDSTGGRARRLSRVFCDFTPSVGS